MSVTATLYLEGDAGELLALVAQWGLKPSLSHTKAIPEPAPNHTNGEAEDEVPPPPVVVIETPAGPREVSPSLKPKRHPTVRAASDLTPGHLQALGALPDTWRTTAELADIMGRRPQGLGNQLRQLADRGLCERCEVEGKPRYRRLQAAAPPAEPAEETDKTPTPLVDLPRRAPTLKLGDLVGNALKVAWALHDHGPQTRRALAEVAEVGEEDDVRETLRILIRQGYVRRDDGPPVRYALTDDVVREEAR